MRVCRLQRPFSSQTVALFCVVAGVAALAGCTTAGGSGFSGDSVSSGRAPEADTTIDSRQASVSPSVAGERDTTPREAIDLLRPLPDDGSVPLIVAGVPAAGLFTPAGTGATPGSDGNTPPGILMGAFTREGSLLLRYRTDEATDLRETLLSSAEDFEVRSVSTIHLAADSPTPNGVRLLLWSAGYEEEIFVLAESPTPYVMRAPVSTVNRTQLQDLNGDGTQEMVRISAVMDARRRREVMVDAYRWTSLGFEHVGSLALLRNLRDRLDELDRRLRIEESATWKAAAAGALVPIDGSPAVDQLLPATHVTIPEIADLSLDLGQRSWELSHEIAVEDSLYRVRILLYPNPLAHHPTQIVGIEGQ